MLPRLLVDACIAVLAVILIRYAETGALDAYWPFRSTRDAIAAMDDSGDGAMAALVAAAANDARRCQLPLRQPPAIVLPTSTAFDFVVATDLDLRSRDPQSFLWTSYLRHGRLLRETAETPADDSATAASSAEASAAAVLAVSYRIEWDSVPIQALHTSLSKENRSLELSELLLFDGNLLVRSETPRCEFLRVGGWRLTSASPVAW